jgi:hypothetical protein
VGKAVIEIAAMPPFQLRALLVAAAGIPLSLLWDYSWESTVGIDYLWAAPHALGYAAVLVAGFLAGMAIRRKASAGVGIWRWEAPLGAWVVLWGAVVFLAAFFFDRWWQSAYGLAAGIWHPPQILKAAAFFAVLIGTYLVSPARERAVAGGALLLMMFVTTLAASFANRQHGPAFYEIGCGVYLPVLVVLAVGGGAFGATRAAAVYVLLGALAVWVLPLIRGEPLSAPIFNPRDHLLPPPFPLLLPLPALVIDWSLRNRERAFGWADAVEVGLGFALAFGLTQWVFSGFLLSTAADHWVFGGGGKQWPFFLQIAADAKTAFWVNEGNGFSVLAFGLALVCARAGLWVASGVRGLRR